MFVGEKQNLDAAHCITLLDAWRTGLDAMRGHPAPPGFSARDWHQFKLDAAELLAVHGPHAVALGWTLEELAGLDRDHPAARVSTSGLARFIHGGKVVEIDASGATIRRLTGSITGFHRVACLTPGAVPAWELHLQKETNVPEFSMGLDTGGGDVGPWLAYHAAGTRDGLIAPGSWSVRDAAGRTTVNLSNGFIADWPSSRTGWMSSGATPGVAPIKAWNTSRSRMEPAPDHSGNWKKAMWMPVAYTPDARAVWEGSSVAAWLGYCGLMEALRDTAPGQLPMLPLVVFTGTKPMRLGAGSTLIPVFRVMTFVPRPDCLPLEEEPAPAPAPQPAAAAAWGARAATPPARGNGAVAASTGIAPPTPLPPSGPLIDDEIPF